MKIDNTLETHDQYDVLAISIGNLKQKSRLINIKNNNFIHKYSITNMRRSKKK